MTTIKPRMERSTSPRSGCFGSCLARLSNPPTRAKTRRHSSGASPREHGSKTQIRVGLLVSNAQQPRGREAAPCQDVLKAFLAKRRLGGLFYHCQLAKHWARAGFEVRQVEREANHADVWELRLRRGYVSTGRKVERLQRQVRLFLKRYGLRYPKREIVGMVPSSRIKAAFNWSRGQPGWLSYDRPKTGRRAGGQR
jgi:hypothetical protein